MTERLATTRALVERVVHLIEQGEPGAAGVTEARNLIAEAGILPAAHVGADRDLDEQDTYEWVLGQFADVIDSGSWFAMNSGLNVAHKYLDQYGVTNLSDAS